MCTYYFILCICHWCEFEASYVSGGPSESFELLSVCIHILLSIVLIAHARHDHQVIGHKYIFSIEYNTTSDKSVRGFYVACVYFYGV